MQRAKQQNMNVAVPMRVRTQRAMTLDLTAVRTTVKTQPARQPKLTDVVQMRVMNQRAKSLGLTAAVRLRAMTQRAIQPGWTTDVA